MGIRYTHLRAILFLLTPTGQYFWSGTLLVNQVYLGLGKKVYDSSIAKKKIDYTHDGYGTIYLT